MHGNSLNSTKPQHIYQINENTPTGPQQYKTGLSGQKLNQNGDSPRLNKQLNELNKANPVPSGQPPKYTGQVVAKDIPGRRAGLSLEQHGVNAHTNTTGAPPPGNVSPKPNQMYGPGARGD
jgi:hypothetical protein